MKVIITMAGAGSRFKEAGIQEEKYRLQVKEQTMFEYAMESLRPFFNHEFIFITRGGHSPDEFLSDRCESLGIEAFQTVELKTLTAGQAATAQQAAGHVDDSESILIYNIDTYVEGGYLSRDKLRGDGCIPVFQTEGGSWSYVKVDESGEALEIREKEPISDLASIGLYYFKKFSVFNKAILEIGHEIEEEYGEQYIAPIYNWLIERGYSVRIEEIPESAVHILGTPSDVIKFDPLFEKRYKI
ncbi:sugar phosphate nucleotidyltransferase [Salinibacter ruber]|uniref:sugar phosphate nucleotidyltransferase n=1 Tax=Salinibacter ruber TaxID=146919 RepID=UPI002167E347|nr:sugar phosphate nucleotidyltransferase [Salinibacter ruber]MCS4057060.1 dTDP-glucose pyrophosphorylase [Salinibacter ruber]